MDALHRILSGGPTRRWELIAAGIFVAVWFAMDVIQFADWVIERLRPAPTAIDLSVLGTNKFTGYYCGSHDCSIPLTQNNAR